MLFNSLHFLFFLPVVVTLYYVLPHKFRWLLIFLASCYFYMSFVPKYILILFTIILIDYCTALAIERAGPRRKKLFLVLSLAANLLLLGFFKYFNFANENLAGLCALLGINFHPINLDIILPIGLSFHTLQSMGYTIEVYRGNQKAERHLGYFANYVLFFPQMVAGPIERYATLGKELRKEHSPLYNNFVQGFRLILFGLLVKMTIADNIAPFVNQVYANPAVFSAPEVILAVVLFAFQIYADFYGYSTIALGSARLLGITIIDNFKTPFCSASVTEFWRRWHISLSTWFNDYVFTSFVTEKRDWGKAAVIVGLLLTFFLSGLWHGAGWNFAIYGLLHGVILVVEFLTKKQRKKLAGIFPGAVFAWMGTVFTFCYVAFSWIFFRSENFAKASAVIKAMFYNSGLAFNPTGLLTPLLAVAALLLADVWLFNSRFDTRLGQTKVAYRWAIYTVLLFCLMALSGTQKFSFIYFQF
jgi:D-alanyl-lipoteichoic acid acyltransferase DltB (MBOAT superfamily)